MFQRRHDRKSTRRGTTIGVLALACFGHLASAQSQCPDWIPTFGGQPGVNNLGIRAFAVFDDGTGPAIFAGGWFTTAGTSEALSIAKWDGSSWSPLGSGVDRRIFALSAFDDGTGPALYAGGEFESAGGVAANNIARWDGASWSALGSGVSEGTRFDADVQSLVVFDDGTGPALYAGGDFTSAGGVEANYIAKWNGTEWSALGSGVLGADPLRTSVFALTVFDDGTGPALYVGGNFHAAGGVPAFCIARWDGATWSALGNGFSDDVHALAVFDDGTGPALYAGGDFLFADGEIAFGIAKWDDVSWSRVASNGAGFADTVTSLAVLDDGSGAALYIGGDFAVFTGLGHDAPIPNGIAKWNGEEFSVLENGVTMASSTNNPSVSALHTFDDGSGPELFVGGLFEFAGDVGASHIARWDGTTWSALESGLNGIVQALTVFDDGTGSAVYLGGVFSAADGVEAINVAKWDGAAISVLGSGMESTSFQPASVSALMEFDDGTGPALYVGGGFDRAGGVSANFIAEWDGIGWSSLGNGLSSGVNALAVFNDGAGSALYAGGRFTTAGETGANRIARWDGVEWRALGSGLDNTVLALSVFDDGSGPALYAGGTFTTAGGIVANNIARWDGLAWLPVSIGMDSWVFAMTVFDDGMGPALYAGGIFTEAGGSSANYVAKWDGAAWSALGSGVSAVSFPIVDCLQVFDEGSGPALVAGGSFDLAGSVLANGIARWDGTDWSALGGGGPINSRMTVRTLTVFDDGTSPHLIIGGEFIDSPAGDSFLARWGPPNGPVCPGDANADRVVDFADITAVLGNWLTGGAEGGDSDCDQSVDFGDITTILGNWQAPCP